MAFDLHMVQLVVIKIEGGLEDTFINYKATVAHINFKFHIFEAYNFETRICTIQSLVLVNEQLYSHVNKL